VLQLKNGMPKALVPGLLVRYAEAPLPTRHGTFTTIVYRRRPAEAESIALTMGRFPTDEPVFVRIHSECITGEVFGSLKCDCGDQLEQAMQHIQRRGHGVVIYLRQEGRGIGLGNKIRAYGLQAAGANTIEANHMLGFETDLRDFRIAAEILVDLGVKRVELHTNNPDKLRALEAHGIEVASRVPAHGQVNPHNRRYLETKHKILGHQLGGLFERRAHAQGK
jgi:3,4-dihydroxy 2-butanone 4-phosphate synthase/GTP cyclohydrolase II